MKWQKEKRAGGKHTAKKAQPRTKRKAVRSIKSKADIGSARKNVAKKDGDSALLIAGTAAELKMVYFRTVSYTHLTLPTTPYV